MKLRKTILGFISLMISVGAMFSGSTTIADATSDDWYYPALGKAEDMPTKPKSSQAPKAKKKVVKHKKVLKKHIKKSTKKHVRKHVKHSKKVAKNHKAK